jgi:predicted aspartyl protease
MAVYSHAYNRRDYDPAMPVVEITVRRATPGELEAPVLALVDSGADATMLPVDVLTAVGARHLETRQMRGVTGHLLAVDTYLVTILLGPYIFPGIEAIAMNEGTEAILGRDVLNQLETTFDGPGQEIWVA